MYIALTLVIELPISICRLISIVGRTQWILLLSQSKIKNRSAAPFKYYSNASIHELESKYWVTQSQLGTTGRPPVPIVTNSVPQEILSSLIALTREITWYTASKTEEKMTEPQNLSDKGISKESGTMLAWSSFECLSPLSATLYHIFTMLGSQWRLDSCFIPWACDRRFLTLAWGPAWV